MTYYTVWVGGVPDWTYANYNQAAELRDEWLSRGYDDATIEATTER